MQTYNKVNTLLETLREIEFNDKTRLEAYLPVPLLNQLALQLIAKIPRSNQELVTEFNDTFKVEREENNEVSQWKTKELRLALILEESIELAFALGFNQLALKNLLTDKIDRVYKKSPFIDNGEKLTETFDALIDLLYVAYGALDCFNFASIAEEGMDEVHYSNMSKVCETQTILRATVEKYKDEGIELVTEKQENGTYIVKNRDTEKVLKSIEYTPANLKQILIKNKIL